MKFLDFCDSERRKACSEIELLQILWNLVFDTAFLHAYGKSPVFSPEDFEIDDKNRLSAKNASGQTDPMYEIPQAKPDEDGFFYICGILAAQLLFGKTIISELDPVTVAVIRKKEPDSSLLLESDLLEKAIPGVSETFRIKLCSIVSKLTSFLSSVREEGAYELKEYGEKIGCEYTIHCFSPDQEVSKDFTVPLPFIGNQALMWPGDGKETIALSNGKEYVFISTPLSFLPGKHTLSMIAAKAPEQPEEQPVFEQPDPMEPINPVPPVTNDRISAASLIGVDLGTETTCIVNADGTLLSIEQDAEYIPSMIFYSSGSDVEIGETANQRGRIYPRACVRGFKRHIGDPNTAGIIVAPNGDRINYTGSSVSTRFVAELIRQLDIQQEEPIRKIVVTVPAMFDNVKKRETINALLAAGFSNEDVCILEEPVAAACFYGCDENSGLTAVFDLGGGTFDFAILDGNRVIGKSGDLFIGGIDFTETVMQIFIDKVTQLNYAFPPRSINMDVPVAKMYHNLFERANAVKIELSELQSAQLHLDFLDTDHVVPLNITITRDEFEERIAHYLDSIRDSVQQGLDDCGISAGSINRVFIMGGSTRIPCVERMIRDELFPNCSSFMDSDRICAVARGAARYAEKHWHDRKELIISVQEQDLGIVTEDREFICIVPRGTPYAPKGISKRDRFHFQNDHPKNTTVNLYHRAPNCTKTRLPLYRTVGADAPFKKIGTMVFHHITSESLKDHVFDVEVGIDGSGVAFVKGYIINPVTGQVLSEITAELDSN